MMYSHIQKQHDILTCNTLEKDYYIYHKLLNQITWFKLWLLSPVSLGRNSLSLSQFTFCRDSNSSKWENICKVFGTGYAGRNNWSFKTNPKSKH